MLLPQTAEYALRAMACLAALPPGEGLRNRDLAAAANIPSAYLSKILRRLVRDGLLISHKGHHGGFQLARPASEICFADVLASAEVDLHGERCAFGWQRCNSEAPCPLHPSYSELKRELSAWALRTSLADVDVRAVEAAFVRARAEAAADPVEEPDPSTDEVNQEG